MIAVIILLLLYVLVSPTFATLCGIIYIYIVWANAADRADQAEADARFDARYEARFHKEFLD